MAGLLDAFNTDEGRFGLGLLAAAAPRADGAGFGQRLAEGVGSLDAWKRQKALEAEQAMRQKMLGMQVDEMQTKVADEQWRRELAKKYWRPEQAGVEAQPQVPVNVANDQGPNLFSTNRSNMSTPGVAGVEARPAGFDYKGFVGEMAQRDPLGAWDIAQKLKPPTTKLGAGEVVFDASGKKILENPKEVAHSDLAKLTSEMMALPEGSPLRQVYAAAIQKATTHAPAPSANVSVAMDKGMAAQIGPMMKESKAAADGAVQTADAAARVIKAAQSGQVLLGPAADARLKIKQISSMLGISGKSDVEIIANTRQAIRGLAEMTLQGRKQMTGQGAITDRESALAEKATSGDINDLTPQELVELARASARASRYVYDSHQRMIEAASKDTEGAKLVPFYKTGNFPAFNFDLSSMTPQGGVDVRSRADAILGGN